MNIRKLISGIVAVAAMVCSCDDNTDDLGGSIVDNLDNIKVDCDTFSIATKSVSAGHVYSRSTTGYLGKVKDPETGGTVEGNFTTQFFTLEGTQLPEEKSIATRLGDGKVMADSCVLYLYYDNYFGDSLATMKLKAMELAQPMKESEKYYSDFNPETLCRKGASTASVNKTYSLFDLTADTVQNKIKVKLPNSLLDENSNIKGEPAYRSNPDLDGGESKPYYNYGTYLMRRYYENPKDFSNAYKFINKVCPGFYFKTTDGLGAMAYINMSQMLIYYKYTYEKTNTDGTKKDTTVSVVTTFAGTEEVIQATKIENKGTAIDDMIAEGKSKGYTIAKSPAGIYTELTIPVDDILRGHENDTLNSARVSLVRINNEKLGKYCFDKPKTLLMVPADSLKEFFENGKLTDNRQSYLAVHSTNDSYETFAKENSYTFHNIASLVDYMRTTRDNGIKTDAQWESKHPNWNKVLIVPVSTTYATVSQQKKLVKVENDMGLTETKLVMGDGSVPAGDKEKIAVKLFVTYSKFEKK